MCNLIGNKIANINTKVSKASPQNNSEENIECDREIHRKYIYIYIYIYIYPEQKQKIIDDL